MNDPLSLYRNVAFPATKQCVYFLDVALAHERDGRVLDAYHACRHSLRLHRGIDLAVQMLARLEAVLETAAVPPPLASTEPHEIGTHDYVNPYTLLNCAETARVTKVSEWFERPENWDSLLGSLSRRRRTLKAELELNDGKLSWLPQLHLNDEVVHRVLSDLDDSGWHPHHWAVFCIPLLNRFLMHGDLEYFQSLEHPPYPLVAEIAGASREDCDQQKFTFFLSSFFCRRWSVALKTALKDSDFKLGRLLFTTTPPVTAVDLDEAVEPVRGHFAARRVVLTKEAAEVARLKSGKGCLKPHLASQESDFLNLLSPNIAATMRDDMAGTYLSLCIALADEAHDFEEADLALKVAERLVTSEPVKKRLADNREILAVHLRRHYQEKKRAEEARIQQKKRADEMRLQEKRRLEAIEFMERRRLEDERLKEERAQEARLQNQRRAEEERRNEQRRAEEARLKQQRCAEEERLQEQHRMDRLTRRMLLKSWFRERTLEISPTRFSWGGKSIAGDKISGIRFGAKYSSGAGSLLALRDMEGRVVVNEWLLGQRFSDAVQSVMGLYSTSLLAKLLSAIEGGSILQIGEAQLSKEGIAFSVGIFFLARQHISWANLTAKMSGWNVHISSETNPRLKITISCRDHWNACLIPTLAEILKHPN